MSKAGYREFWRESLAISVLCGAVILFYYFFLYPSQKSVLDLKDRTAQIESRLAMLERIGTAESELARFESGIIKKEEFPSAIENISDLAEANYLEIPSIRYKMDKVEHFNFTRVKIDFLAFGEYPDIRRFLHKLETSPYFIVIDNLAIKESKKKAATDGLPVTIELEISAYFGG